MTYDTIIDSSMSSLVGVGLLGNVLITKDSGTPAGDPVVVTSGLANVTGVSSFTVSNGATFDPGGLLGAGVASAYIIDGGILDINSTVSISALNTFAFTANGGEIVVEPGLLNLNLNSAVTGWSGKSSIDFPTATSVTAFFNGTNTVLTAVGGVGLIPQSITISGDIYSLPNGGTTTITMSDGSGGILVCFLAGTQIETAEGEVPVEAIRVHDRVVTVVNGARVLRKVTWVGTKTVDLTTADASDDDAPIRIKRDAIADGVPRRDLIVTGDHCLFFDGHLMPARVLVNGRSIVKDTSLRKFEVFHIETETHAILISDGALSESYLDTGNRGSFAGRGVRIVSPFVPKSWADDAAAPLGVTEAVVGPVWARLDARATACGYAALDTAELTTDPDLRLLCGDGTILRPLRTQGDRLFFRLPPGQENLTLVSRTARPSDVQGAFLDDRRKLGVRIGEIGVWRGHERSAYTGHLEAAVAAGWMEQEGSSSRWTSGRGQLSLDLAVSGRLMLLEVQVVAAGPYHRLTAEAVSKAA